MNGDKLILNVLIALMLMLSFSEALALKEETHKEINKEIWQWRGQAWDSGIYMIDCSVFLFLNPKFRVQSEIINFPAPVKCRPCSSRHQ